MKFAVASWNIAGGRKMKSHNLFDYEPEDLNYFADEIKKIDPEVICLQESHFSSSRSSASELAGLLNLTHIYETPVSPSHIDSGYQLSLAIISKFPIGEQKFFQYPYPDFDLVWKNGAKADIHHKGFQQTTIDGHVVVNTHIFPIQIWGHSYNRGHGARLAKEIEKILIKIPKPAVICGDFNIDQVEKIYPDFIDKLSLKEALPHKTTRPNKSGKRRTPDHILYSSEIKLGGGDVIKTQTDHYLCWAEFNI